MYLDYNYFLTFYDDDLMQSEKSFARVTGSQKNVRMDVS